jgi:hypothetical protein
MAFLMCFGDFHRNILKDILAQDKPRAKFHVTRAKLQ